MKPLFFAALLALGLTSCSSCYECSYETLVNGTPETVTEDVCATAEEIKIKEDAGYSCSLSN